MTPEDPVPGEWFANPTLESDAAERVRRRVLSAVAPPPLVVPEATLAAVFSIALMIWAALAVTAA